MNARRLCIACEKPVAPVVGAKVWRHTDGTGAAHPCPVCDLPAYLLDELDRFVHADGSANAECWRAMSLGPLHAKVGGR